MPKSLSKIRFFISSGNLRENQRHLVFQHLLLLLLLLNASLVAAAMPGSQLLKGNTENVTVTNQSTVPESTSESLTVTAANIPDNTSQFSSTAGNILAELQLILEDLSTRVRSAV